MSITINGNGTITGFEGNSGSVIQVKQSVKKDVFTATVSSGGVSGDITGLTVTITPSNANNKMLLVPSVSGSDYVRNLFIYKDGSLLSDAIGDASGSLQRVAFGQNVNSVSSGTFGGMYLDTAGGTSAITYSLRAGTSYASQVDLFINRVQDADETHSSYVMGRYISTFTVMEIKA